MDVFKNRPLFSFNVREDSKYATKQVIDGPIIFQSDIMGLIFLKGK